MISKGDIVSGTYQLIRISGLTTNPSPEENEIALQVLDDYMGELKPTLNLGYIQPQEYGKSKPSDYSGLTNEMAGPVKKLLAMELLSYFGKEVPQLIVVNAAKGMKSLEHQVVSVLDAKNPDTLPIGSGNEWDYRSNKFYPRPTTDNYPEDHYRDDVFNLVIDWLPFLGSANLVTVTYDADPEIVLSNQTIIDSRKSSVTVTFSQLGQYTLCATATNPSNGEILTKKFIYNSLACRDITLLP